MERDAEAPAATGDGTQNGLTLLTRQQILDVHDQQFELVRVDEWGGWVRVRGMTGREGDEFQKSIVKGAPGKQQVDTTNWRARLVARTVVDVDGNQLFSDKDIVALGQKSASALQRVFNVALRLAGMSERDAEELEGELEPAGGGN